MENRTVRMHNAGRQKKKNNPVGVIIFLVLMFISAAGDAGFILLIPIILLAVIGGALGILFSKGKLGCGEFSKTAEKIKNTAVKTRDFGKGETQQSRALTRQEILRKDQMSYANALHDLYHAGIIERDELNERLARLSKEVRI